MCTTREGFKENTETKSAKSANPRKTMSTPSQLELIPTRRPVATITVAGAEMATIEKHLHDIGAVLLGFSVKGATYKLQVTLPPGMVLPGSLDANL